MALHSVPAEDEAVSLALDLAFRDRGIEIVTGLEGVERVEQREQGWYGWSTGEMASRRWMSRRSCSAPWRSPGRLHVEWERQA